ncbi:MAG: hypothetical protein EXR71_11945 [Myxococcales bacterium]|nr:hypothetical protein [Myxococcales bacterium]
MLRTVLGTLARAGAALLGAYALAVLGLFVFQRAILFPLSPSDPFLVLAGANRVQVAVPGGTVPMDLSGPAGATRVAFFHGNAGQIGQIRRDAAFAEAEGLAFAAIEYPGYGDAQAGVPNEKVILLAARFLALEHGHNDILAGDAWAMIARFVAEP